MVKIRVQTCRRSCLCSLLVVLAPMKATHEKIGKSFTFSANNMHQGTSYWVFAIKSSITKADRWKNYVLGSDKMPEIQLGGHTIVSHGVKLARLHMLDWLIVVLLGTIELILKFVAPFNRFIGEDMMTDLKYPMKSNTVPFWVVQLVVLLLPFAIFSAYYYYRRDVYDFHHAILGLLFSVLVTGVITNVIKDAVGRPRPDFYWRCFPDGKPHYDPITGNVICHGDKSVIKEGRKSFPSGHTSWSFSGLGFLAWYLSGKIRVFDCQGHVAKLCLVILPLLVASLVGISRVDDYHHHWQDVFAGGLLGFMVASFCYLHFFPPPYDPHGWGPHAYFQMLAESPNSARSTSTYHFIQQPMENESLYIPPRYSA